MKPLIHIQVDDRPLQEFAKHLTRGEIQNAMRRAIDQSARAARKQTIPVIEKEIGVSKLDMVRSEQPHGQYLPLDRSLTRQAARAAGESYETVSGDFSETSYSASRLAMIPPHRVSMRRRREIIIKIYQAVYEAVCEESAVSDRT